MKICSPVWCRVAEGVFWPSGSVPTRTVVAAVYCDVIRDKGFLGAISCIIHCIRVRTASEAANLSGLRSTCVRAAKSCTNEIQNIELVVSLSLEDKPDKCSRNQLLSIIDCWKVWMPHVTCNMINVRAVWCLLMTWHPLGARTSASIMMTLTMNPRSVPT